MSDRTFAPSTLTNTRRSTFRRSAPPNTRSTLNRRLSGTRLQNDFDFLNRSAHPYFFPPNNHSTSKTPG